MVSQQFHLCRIAFHEKVAFLKAVTLLMTFLKATF